MCAGSGLRMAWCPPSLPAYDARVMGVCSRLFRWYQFVHQRIHSTTPPMKIYFHVGTHETILGWVTSSFELYAAFGPLVTKPAAINSVLRLIRWIKKEESKLFILGSMVF